MSETVAPQLGLVCITTTDAVRFRALTRKRLLQFDTLEQKRMLRELYADNLVRLNGALDFCSERGLKLYRLTSGLFPFADDEAGADVLEEFQDEARRTGERATALGIRLVIHPDQFVVLSSDSEGVIANSIKILQTHAHVLDLLAQPRTSWTVIEIHGGKGDRTRRLVEVIRALPDAIRKRLALENDEYAYSAAQILEVCREARVPMVFDAHHHVCREKLTSYEDESVAHFLAAARETWPVPEWQLVHISNGRTAFNDRHHSDLITDMPSAYAHAPWIEVEAKHKELAIEKLRIEWLAKGMKELRHTA
ncbi:MAG: UV DNA damage repair endonuclease UvsE [Acidobacteria bacterium]|nr:UV DNA damage repair endonuclease UvsE [Acidobacteriota bacterium]